MGVSDVEPLVYRIRHTLASRRTCACIAGTSNSSFSSKKRTAGTYTPEGGGVLLGAMEDWMHPQVTRTACTYSPCIASISHRDRYCTESTGPAACRPFRWALARRVRSHWLVLSHDHPQSKRMSERVFRESMTRCFLMSMTKTVSEEQPKRHQNIMPCSRLGCSDCHRRP